MVSEAETEMDAGPALVNLGGIRPVVYGRSAARYCTSGRCLVQRSSIAKLHCAISC